MGKQQVSCVVDISYGDSGKGTTVAGLSDSDTLVIRHNGGSQAGHTVIKGGIRHIFSSLGSGTLNGAATYWSEYCTFSPELYYNERELLEGQGVRPRFYIHPLAMITTPWDVMHNRSRETRVNHGSVGLGFSSTIERNLTPYKLYAVDLVGPKHILQHKLRQIEEYYSPGEEDPNHILEGFMKSIDNLNIFETLRVCLLEDVINKYFHIVFEGAQGIMLDQRFGFFPYVTRSNTTSQNAWEIIRRHNLAEPTMYYVMRAYATRHGNGPFLYEDTTLQFEDLTNKIHVWQGKFRQGYHSSEELMYALQCDQIFSGSGYQNKKLIINCLDQTGGLMYVDGKKETTEEFIKRFEYNFQHVIADSSGNQFTHRQYI